jgi:PAS domain S-box-containing protein
VTAGRGRPNLDVIEDAPTADSAAYETVEELLGQLLDARFVLTDRDGAVTRWSRPAEELFGWSAARMLGRPLVATIGLGVQLPERGGVLQAAARRKDGQALELALTLVPVRMSQSLEFNGFLEALEVAAPRGNALAQLQQSHRTVVDWIHAAVAGEAEVEDDGLTAGTIVAFRTLSDPPPPAQDRDDDNGGPVVIAHSQELERLLEEAASARQEAASAAEQMNELRSQLEGTLDKLNALEQSVSEERGLAEWIDEVHTRLSAFEATLGEVPAAAEARLIELHAKLEGLERAGVLEADMQEMRSNLERLTSRAEQAAESVAERTAQLEQLATRVEEAATGASEAASSAAEAAEQARRSAVDAAAEADAVRRAAEQGVRLEVGPSSTAPAAPAQPGSAAQPANGNDPHRPLFGRKHDPGPAREPRPGFDDAAQPMAVIDLDGHFRELNKGFSDLVGYSEAEFKAASWPPVMDRANLEKHREQMRQLVEGTIESADVNTGYVHAQGLLVPVAGRISFVREGGEPDHFLLVVG